jgi:hypothetical protein
MTSANRCSRCGALAGQARVDAHAAGFEAGRVRGFAEAAELRAEAGLPVELADLLPDLLQLVHPDRHEGAQWERAHAVTVALLAWRERRGR